MPFCPVNHSKKNVDQENAQYCNISYMPRDCYGKITQQEFHQAIKWNGLIEEFGKCCICDWSEGTVDLAHALPIREKGEYEFGNIFPLCPNHHRIFDHGTLKDEDIQKLHAFNKDIKQKITQKKASL